MKSEMWLLSADIERTYLRKNDTWQFGHEKSRQVREAAIEEQASGTAANSVGVDDL